MCLSLSVKHNVGTVLHNLTKFDNTVSHKIKLSSGQTMFVARPFGTCLSLWNFKYFTVAFLVYFTFFIIY